MRKRHHKRRLSLITDVLIFIVLLVIASPFLKLLNSNSIEKQINYESVLALNNSEILEKSIKEQNKLFIQKIKEYYGISIKYGDETKGLATNVNAVGQYDDNIVNNNIILIQNALEKYPKTLFDTFKNGSVKCSVSIILLDKFNNNNLALASKNGVNDFKIYLSNTQKFERAFHHEVFHIMEYYMQAATNVQIIYPNWNNLNPFDFSYTTDLSKIDNKYVYASRTDLSKIYFVSKYSKTSAKEDRAEIFAELMIMNKKSEYLKDGQNIRKKAEYISQIIDKNLKNLRVVETKYWNNYIK
ncbi:MAG: hypothetical protein N2749_05265 [Clostridia bacterium]|nr:hypothetical protein [Clostridia bacterium]